MDPNDVLGCIWILQSWPRALNEEESTKKESFFGGAICVDPAGILATVTLGIKPPICEDYPVVFARRFGQVTPPAVEARWIRGAWGQSYGLCILKLENPNNQQFPTCSFAVSRRRLDVFDQVFAFLNPDNVEPPASHVTGVVTCPILGRVAIPDDETDPVTIVGRRRSENRTILRLYSTACFVAGEDCIARNNRQVGDIIGYLAGLNISMPLIEVKGFDETTMDGQCGFPVFTLRRNTLLGLLAFSAGFFQFVIPINIVVKMLEMNLQLIEAAKVAGQVIEVEEPLAEDEEQLEVEEPLAEDEEQLVAEIEELVAEEGPLAEMEEPLA